MNFFLNFRFPNTSPPPPGLPPLNSLQTNTSSGNNVTNNGQNEPAGDFNPTAAYLWLLSQQQQQQASAASAALNLSSRNATPNNGAGSINANGTLAKSSNCGAHANNNHHSQHNSGHHNEHDETTDDEDDDDVESHTSSHSDNPVSSTGFNGKCPLSWFLDTLTNLLVPSLFGTCL